MLEYILMGAMLFGAVFGLFWPRLQGYISGLQNSLRAPLISRLGQRERGLPARWFFVGADFAQIDSKLGPNAQSGGASGSNASGGGAGSSASGSSSPGTANNPSSGAPGSSASGPSQSGDSSESSRRNQSSASRNQSGENSEGESRRETTPVAPTNSGNSSGPETETRNTEGAPGGDDALNAESGVTDDQGPETAIKRRNRLLKEEERRQAEGCGNFDLWMMLKIIVLLAIVVLAIALATMSGKKKQD